jgi:hypothetical protein
MTRTMADPDADPAIKKEEGEEKQQYHHHHQKNMKSPKKAKKPFVRKARKQPRSNLMSAIGKFSSTPIVPTPQGPRLRGVFCCV